MSYSAFGVEDSRETVEKFTMPKPPGMAGAFKPIKAAGAKAVTGTQNAGKKMMVAGRKMENKGFTGALSGSRTGLRSAAGDVGRIAGGSAMQSAGSAIVARPKTALGIAGGTAAGGGAMAMRPKQPKQPGMR